MCKRCIGTPMPNWPLRDLIRDGRLSTYDESVLKLSKNSFRGKCAHTGHPLKLPSPTKISRLGPPPCRPVVLYYFFSPGTPWKTFAKDWIVHKKIPQQVCQCSWPCLEFSLEPLAAGHLTLLLPLLRPYLQKTIENYLIPFQNILITLEILRLDNQEIEATFYAKLLPFARNLFIFLKNELSNLYLK